MRNKLPTYALKKPRNELTEGKHSLIRPIRSFPHLTLTLMTPALSANVRVTKRKTVASTSAPNASALPLAIVTDAALTSDKAPRLLSLPPPLDPPPDLVVLAHPVPTPFNFPRK